MDVANATLVSNPIRENPPTNPASLTPQPAIERGSVEINSTAGTTRIVSIKVISPPSELDIK